MGDRPQVTTGIRGMCLWEGTTRQHPVYAPGGQFLDRQGRSGPIRYQPGGIGTRPGRETAANPHGAVPADRDNRADDPHCGAGGRREAADLVRNEDRKSVAEIARTLGIIPQRVSQLEASALRKIRDGLKARGYDEEITAFLSAWLAGYRPGS